MKEQQIKRVSVQSSTPAGNPSCNPPNNRWKFVLLCCIFLAALGIRLIHINTPYLEFHPSRQYHSANIARDYYLQWSHDVPDWKKTIAKENQRLTATLEPRIMETLVVGGYLLNGGEAYWIPRLYSILFWLIGGLFLYGIARAYFSYPSALISLCFYLFLPFGIFASRSFQPDPLMIMLMLATWWGLVCYARDESGKQLGFVTLMAALALLVKIQVLPFVDGAFVILWLMSGNFRRPSGWRKLMFYLVGAHFFAFLFYGWRISTGSSVQIHTSSLFFITSLYIQADFWWDWITMIWRTVGAVPVLLALIGWRWVTRGALRHQLLGFWLGYLVYGLAFTYTIHTHDYYQLPLIPLVALTLGQSVWQAICGLRQWPRPIRYLSTAGISVVLLIVVGLTAQPSSPLKKIIPSDVRASIELGCNALGANTNMVRNFNRSYEDWVTAFGTMGEQVNHSQRVMYAAPFWCAIPYHAWINAKKWPEPYTPVLKGEILPKFLPERFGIMYDWYEPEYFILFQPHASKEKPELELFLSEHYPLFAQGKIYKIYHIDSPPPNTEQSRPESP